MTEVKDGVQNNEGEQKTPIQTNPADENNNQNQGEETPQKNEGSEEQEEVKISKAEFEKIQKKAKDFDGIIEKQRLEKLKNKEKTEVKTDVDQAKLDELIEAKLNEKLGAQNKEQYDSNLTEAYRDFIKSNPWADKDEVIASISGEFNPGGAVNKADLLVRIGQAAERLYPTEYESARIARIKSQVLAGEHSIDAGDIGGSSSRAQQFENKKQLTEAQLEMCRKSGTDPKDVYPEYFIN